MADQVLKVILKREFHRDLLIKKNFVFLNELS